MSIDPADEWWTGEYDDQQVRPGAPEGARPAVACPASTAQAIEDVNRYASSRNDDIGDI